MRLTPKEMDQLFGKIPKQDRQEALDIVESDYTEILFDTNVHPIEIGVDKHLRFVPDVVNDHGMRVLKHFTQEERKNAEKSDRIALKHMGYTLEQYFETPIVRAWCVELEKKKIKK